MKRRIIVIVIITIFIFIPTSMFSQGNKITIIKIVGDKFAINQGINHGIRINTYYFIIQQINLLVVLELLKFLKI